MKRIALTDGSGKWFDADKAERFEEETYWNGNNHISKATGSQTEHECLFITKTGNFVLHGWSQWQGVPDYYKSVSREFVANWFSKQGIQDEDIPNQFLKDVYALEL